MIYCSYLPPKICIPRRAKIKMNRTSRTNRATMDEIELTRDLTRLPMADQYLENKLGKFILLYTIFGFLHYSMKSVWNKPYKMYKFHRTNLSLEFSKC